MSAREVTPRSLRAASMRGPTPGSSVTGRARRSVRVVLARNRTPMPGSALEVGHAIRPRTDVGPYAPAYLAHKLHLYAEPLCELREELGGCDVPEVQGMPGLGCGFDFLDYGRDLALAAAGSPVWNYLPILDAQYGAD